LQQFCRGGGRGVRAGHPGSGSIANIVEAPPCPLFNTGQTWLWQPGAYRHGEGMCGDLNQA